MTRSQIEKIKRAYEKCEAERAEAKAQLTAFIREWCAEKHGNLSELARKSDMTATNLHKVIAGKGRIGLDRLIALAQMIIPKDTKI